MSVALSIGRQGWFSGSGWSGSATGMRPYLAAGVAVVGASLIAVNPVAPTIAADIEHRVSASVELTAGAYADLFDRTVTDLEGLYQTFAADPFPIAQQVIANQTTNFQNIGVGLQKAGQGFMELLDPSNPNGIVAILDTFVGDLANGQPVNAFSTLAAGTLFSLLPLLPALTPLNTAIASTFDNLAAGVTTLTTNLPLLIISLVSPSLAGLEGFGYGLQNIVDAWDAGNLLGVGTGIVDLPATTLNSFLNGYDISHGGDIGLGGLLGSVNFNGSQNPGGTIGAVHNLLVEIAQSLTSTNATHSAAAAVDAAANLNFASVAEGLNSLMPSVGFDIPQAFAQAMAPAGEAVSNALLALDPASVTAGLTTALDPGAFAAAFDPAALSMAFDPAAVTDIGSMLAAGLAPNLSGIAFDLLSLF